MSAPTLANDLDEALNSEAFFADPYSTYARLRDADPVHWCEPWGQWVVTSFTDVLAVNKDPVRFSSSGWEKKFMSQLPPQLQQLPHMQRHYGTQVLSMTDPPEHTRLRRLVIRSFTPRVIEGLRASVDQIVSELLDACGHESEVDLIEQFAYPLPAIVIAKLLGAPEDGREDFMRWSRNIVDFVGTGHPDEARALRLEQTLIEFRAFLEPVIEDRRANPQNDLISILASADTDGERLTDDEIVSTCIVFLFAGHETTANLIGNGLLALLRHPDQLELLRSRPDLTQSAVEELLRYDSPVQRNRRLATQDLEFGGKQIKQGDAVMVFMGSANRDRTRFPDPDTLDVTRSPNQHMAFGHGIHFCAGAALSRLEAPIAIRALLDRFPALRLSDDFEERWHRNITFRGLESLNVRFD
jgi:cytochrome P450